MIGRIARFMTRVVSRWLPDPLIFAMLLTLLTFGIALWLTPQTPISMVKFWGGRFLEPAGVWYADGADHRNRPCISQFRAGEKPAAYGGIRRQNPCSGRNVGHFFWFGGLRY